MRSCHPFSTEINDPQKAELDARTTEFRGYEADGEEYRELDGDGGYTHTPELGAGGANEPTAEMSGEGPALEMPAHPIYEMGGGWEGAGDGGENRSTGLGLRRQKEIEY